MTQVCRLELALSGAELRCARPRHAEAQAACRFLTVGRAATAAARVTGAGSERLGSFRIRSPP
jgi:hypothetical protein